MMLATFAEVMETIGYVLLALLALVVMVVIHELGHYLAAKSLKFKVVEFGIGFGPRIFKWTNPRNGEIFSIRPIPLGGFCQFVGEDEVSDNPDAFDNQPAWKRLIVLFSGAFFNLVSAWVIITFFFTFYGQILPTVGQLYPDADGTYEHVLQEGDAILRVDGKQVNVLMPEDASALLSKAGDTAELVVLRDGKKVKLTVSKSTFLSGTYDENGNFVPATDDAGNVVTYRGFGFGSVIRTVKLNFFTSLGRSFSFMFFLVYKILAILGMLITGKIGLENAGGPITTIGVISEASRGGAAMLSYVVCLISANLAVMNLLPLPALDGSRMVFCLIEMIFRKPVNKKIEAAIHTVGFFAILGFAIFADIFRWIKLG